MARMTHPTLPGQPIHVADSAVPVHEKAGWVLDENTVEAPNGTERPADRAGKPAWVDWAVANGADREAAELLTVPKLIEQYGS